MTDKNVQTYKQLSERDHIILRPSMYIGAIDLTKVENFHLVNNKIEFTEIEYVPGIIKAINEILDNSIDVAIKSKFKSSNQIEITIKDNIVNVKDNGTGIPVSKNEDGIYIPHLCWGLARAGSNFTDDENRTQLGMNGVGSYLTNCFSKRFQGNTDDGKNSFEIVYKDNASTHEYKVNKTSGKTGTSVNFELDLEKFGVKEIDQTHIDVINHRLVDLKGSFPLINFKLNGQSITINTFKKYVNLFSEESLIIEGDNFKFALCPNSMDDFKHYTFVNGLKLPDGGTHVDYITTQIVNRLREKIQKKYKNIKPADIKNKLAFIGLFTGFKNPKFNSQAKEKITNSFGEVSEYLGDIDFDKIALQIFKDKAFIEPITEIYRIKAEFKRRQDMKSLDKPTKKIKSEKYQPAIGSNKRLFIAEGDCLSENSETLMHDYTTRKISDVNIGDSVISDDFTIQKVYAKTKLLKKSITLKTNNGEIVCGVSHRFKVYIVDKKDFGFVDAETIHKNINNYKFLKSKINKDSEGLLVKSHDVKNHKITTFNEGTNIEYTSNDYFVIIRNGFVMRMYSEEIMIGDFIMLS